tara:strand:- start:80 stop:1123 length:1044 start_codon:yes stop_codon:yes gene_type:complete
MGRRNGSFIGKKNIGVGVTNNASGIWGLNDSQRVMGPDNSSALKSKIEIKYLLVGGGGGGAGAEYANIRGGGGGAGGMLEGTFTCNHGDTINLTVGNGGPGGYEESPGSDGNNSEISKAGSSPIKAFGGGGGQGYNDFSPPSTKWGASGGGLGFSRSNPGSTVISGYMNQGHPGGWMDTSPPQVSYQKSASGGGGAGGKGGDASPIAAGDGGVGKISYITGSGVYYAGGGGGGAKNGHTRGDGGNGGGGNGGLAPGSTTPGVQAGSAGQDNTGGGGGGAACGTNATNPNPASGGNGGKGIIILRYPTSVGWSGGSGLSSAGNTPIPGTDERYVKFTNGNGQITIVVS